MNLVEGVDLTKQLEISEQFTRIGVMHDIIHEGDVAQRIDDTDRAMANNQYRHGRLREWTQP